MSALSSTPPRSKRTTVTSVAGNNRGLKRQKHTGYDVTAYEKLDAGWVIPSEKKDVIDKFKKFKAGGYYKFKNSGTSVVWQHGIITFDKDQPMWTCIHCAKRYAHGPNSVSNFRRHLVDGMHLVISIGWH